MFKNANQFSLYIEGIVNNTDFTYTEAILNFCEENMLEPEDVKVLVSKSLKDKLYIEMTNATHEGMDF